MSASLIMPGRSNCHEPSAATLTMLDSMPTWQAPPSNTGMFAPKPASTWSAVVGLSCVNKFADGAATLNWLSFNKANVRGWFGTRSAMVASPPLTTLDTWLFAGKIKVRGPGQNAWASLMAVSGKTLAQLGTWFTSLICTISGWSAGRCLVLKILARATSLLASAANPYTVSVGMATNSPCFSLLAASSKLMRIKFEADC